MRHLAIAIVLVAGCKGEAKKPAAKPPTQAAPAAIAETTSPAEVLPIERDAAPIAQKAPSWQLLIAAAEALKSQWEELPAEERFSFYKDWSRKAGAPSAKLREETDADELTELAAADALPPAVRAEAEEGYYYALYVSEAWLLKTFPALPKDERAYLQWQVDMDRDHWFAEGNLEVSVQNISNGYKAGAAILRANPETWRKSDIERTLAAIFRDLAGLLWSPAPYKAQRFQADLKKALQVVAKQGPHSQAAAALLRAFPAKGVPYEGRDVEVVL